MFDFHVCITEAERRICLPCTNRHVVVSGRGGDREREADRLAGRNARICWSWDFFFLPKAFFFLTAFCNRTETLRKVAATLPPPALNSYPTQ